MHLTDNCWDKLANGASFIEHFSPLCLRQRSLLGFAVTVTVIVCAEAIEDGLMGLHL